MVKESNNSPNLGLIEHFKYYSVRHGDNGDITIVATTAKLPEYPLSNAMLNLFLIHISPTEGGSNLTIVMQSVVSHPMDQAVKMAIAHGVKDYYMGVIGEVQGIQA